MAHTACCKGTFYSMNYYIFSATTIYQNKPLDIWEYMLTTMLLRSASIRIATATLQLLLRSYHSIPIKIFAVINSKNPMYNRKPLTLTSLSALQDTSMSPRSCIPDVSEWCPDRTQTHMPLAISQTLIVVSRLPLTTMLRVASNWKSIHLFGKL